jgi:hypothetical protein
MSTEHTVQISLDGFKQCEPPHKFTFNDINYNIIATRYDGYGIYVSLYLDVKGCPHILHLQDYGDQTVPLIFDLTSQLSNESQQLLEKQRQQFALKQEQDQ